MRALGALLAVALAANPGGAALAQPACAEDLSLLHLAIDPSAISRLQIWNHQKAEWQVPAPEQEPLRRAPVVIVHLWADWCGPCKAEMPLLRTQVQDLASQHKENVEFVFLTESNRTVELARYMIDNRDRMPRVPYYLDTNEAIARLVRINLPSGQLTLPVTLLLDEQRVVRQAFVGALAPRWPELRRSVARLLHLSARRASGSR